VFLENKFCEVRSSATTGVILPEKEKASKQAEKSNSFISSQIAKNGPRRKWKRSRACKEKDYDFI
jgi:hypothetical protein